MRFVRGGYRMDGGWIGLPIIRSRSPANICGTARVEGGGAVRRSIANVENAIRTHLSVGNGILKVAAMVGVWSGTVRRVKGVMVAIASCRPASTGRGD